MDAHRTADGASQRLHATRPRPDRVFLVGAELTDTPESWPAEDSLGELELLAETDGLEVVGSTYQRLKRPNARFYIGSGKVAEIAELRERLRYDVVIFDDELTPSQARNLEEALDTPVLDRTGLILDIFAQHAHTHEGRIQVELAQYNYMLPRLRGRGGGRQVSASGTAAGGVVGLRGPGETQLELDRRRIRGRIADLHTQLEEVRQQRELYRRQRRESGVPIIALVGYTNSGKSTLLNALTTGGVAAQDRLFETLDPTTRQLDLPGGRQVLLTDTVGFIQKLPTQLVAAFRATLEEIHDADLLLHVVDVTHPQAGAQAQVVRATLEELHAGKQPTQTVLNKIDELEEVDAAQLTRQSAEMGMDDGFIAISARHGWNLDVLLRRIEELLAQSLLPAEALIPYSRGDLVAQWRERGLVEQEEHRAEGSYLVGRVPASLAAALEPFRTRRERYREVGRSKK
ncbi:MAG TPA: GTPase HflX [Roseiflexaceae bacterium]|nr:GTPase HflX [Roseiflexaceae bacterium]